MVNELETLPQSYGKNRTLLWLRAYEEFDKQATSLWDFVRFNDNPNKSFKLGFENLDFFLSQLNYPPGIKTEFNEK